MHDLFYKRCYDYGRLAEASSPRVKLTVVWTRIQAKHTISAGVSFEGPRIVRVREAYRQQPR